MTVRATVVGRRLKIALALVVTLIPATAVAQGRGGPPLAGGSLPAIEERVGALELQLEALQQLAEQFNQALGTAETKVANLEGKLATLQAYVDGLEGGLTAYDQLAGLPCVTTGNASGTALFFGPLKSAVCAVGVSTNGRFADLGPVIFDTQTNLTWEKKDDGAGLHNVDDTYHWCTELTKGSGRRDICVEAPDTVFWIDLVNAESFAGSSDWRVPTEDELKSIIDDTAGPPRIDPIFGLTRSGNYWTVGEDVVNFADAGAIPKPGGAHSVRAVRGQRAVTPVKPTP